MAEERKKLTLSLNKDVVAKTTFGSGVKVEVKKKRVFSNVGAEDGTAVGSSSVASDRDAKLRALLDNAKKEEAKAAEFNKTLSKANEKKEEILSIEKAEKEALEVKKREEVEAKLKEEQEVKRRDEKLKKFGGNSRSHSSEDNIPEPVVIDMVVPFKRKDSSSEIEDPYAKKVVKKTNSNEDTRRSKFSVAKAKLQYIAGGSDDDNDFGSPRNVGLKKLRSNKRLMDRKPKEKVLKSIDLPEVITVKELAERLSEKSGSVIKELMKMGMMTTINESIDQDTAELVASELGHTVNRISSTELEDSIKTADDLSNQVVMIKRPPVVTVMGHVDHGKTSLLDALRRTDVVAGEAGGITQHIGAYQITVGDEKITFIDTPGHEAFSAMRSRGANVTDIVVLVVAANDSIMPQTIEAIHHAQEAKVPIIVAINKIDLPDADPKKVRMDLLQHGLVVEEMGGDVQAIELSAKKKINLDKLEEAILLQAEMLQLVANPDRKSEGNVIEAEVKKGLGSTATVLIQKGTLRKGDIFVSGKSWGRVRDMIDDKGKSVKEAFPSYPVAVLGFDVPPAPGDDFVVVETEAKARKVAEFRIHKAKQEAEVLRSKSLIENMFAGINAEAIVSVNVVIKADTQGSIEALRGTLEKVGNDVAKCRVIAGSVGGITKNDVSLARNSGAVIVAFNVRAEADARLEAKNVGVDIRYYSIIYNVVDDVKALLTGKLEPTYKEHFVGYANVLQVFKVGKSLVVAGCRATEGVIKRSNKCRIIRNDIVVYEGDIGMLKREKNEAKEVSNGMEFGMSFAKHNDIKIGDRIECFELETIAGKL